MKRYIYSLLSVVLFSIFFTACENVLEEELYSELGAANFLSTAEGIDATLNGAYDGINRGPQAAMYHFLFSHISTGIGWGLGGSFERVVAVPLHDFTWDSEQGHMRNWWDAYYDGIRNANIVIDYVDIGDFTDEFKTNKRAEAIALRGYFYHFLYKLFGPTPIFTESDPISLVHPRATDEAMRSQIENDLIDAAGALPVEQEQFGRVTKGGVLGVLCKFYLNTKQWQKCIDAARDIIDLAVYELVPDYKDIYSHENEGNAEILWVITQISAPREESSNIIAILTPPDYPVLPGQLTYAARSYVYDSFYDSFDESDTRRDLIETFYVNKSGDTIPGYGSDKSLYNKYPMDPNGMGDSNGLDFIYVRYADILLSLAESLNELNGPNQEAIDLINQVRIRAKVDELQLADFSTKEALRDHLLNERLWEFYLEGLEREDFLRHDKFISGAIARGITNAKEFHKLYPIPQREVDANPELVQNPGY